MHARTHTHTCGISELKAPVGKIDVCMGLHQDVELWPGREDVKWPSSARVTSQQRSACIAPITHDDVVAICQVNVHTLQVHHLVSHWTFMSCLSHRITSRLHQQQIMHI